MLILIVRKEIIGNTSNNLRGINKLDNLRNEQINNF